MTLYLAPHHLDRIQTHALQTYPHECCGLLIGRFVRADSLPSSHSPSIPSPPDSTLIHPSIDRLITDRPIIDRIVTDVQVVSNAWSAEVAEQLAPLLSDSEPQGESEAHGCFDRYWIDPVDLLQAQREARDRQLSILGVYHSHPNQVAIPSETDRRLAWSDYAYLIVSVQAKAIAEVRCWCLSTDQPFPHQSFVTESIRLTG